ncbi:nmrA-like family domain-containing protein 1 isoform X2 [Branchiostoma floridae x Branchiostoma belcheri]
MTKVIAVFGATGAQGGGVANALLEDTDFEVRVVTRNASSDKARALQERGADVVQANYDDPGTLGPAMQGAYGAFVVINYWEHRDFHRAVMQGKAVADAAKSADVQHVVFSTLEHVQKIAGFPCQHFDSKALVDEYMTLLNLPVTFVKYPFFYENYLKARKILKLEDGTYEIVGAIFQDIRWRALHWTAAVSLTWASPSGRSSRTGANGCAGLWASARTNSPSNNTQRFSPSTWRQRCLRRPR